MKDTILLDHGSGGKASHNLIKDLILPAFDNPTLNQLDDGAVVTVDDQRLAFSTDSYVVDPIFFPGGCIGDLAVNGTVNDLAMCGAQPLFLSAGLIIEEGFSVKELNDIIKNMTAAAKHANVTIVTGDTKVVPKGAADKIFINTSGIGKPLTHAVISGANARPGDKIILSGSIADHGVTILMQREGLSFEADIQSDTAPLNTMVEQMLAVSDQVHVLRDPTRGGVGTTLNEIALQSKAGIKIYEDMIPVQAAVIGLCELLGLDPLYIANEGKLLACVSASHTETILAAVRENPFGQEACIIGEVTDAFPGQVFMQTRIGGRRIVDMLTGEQLPRIC